MTAPRPLGSWRLMAVWWWRWLWQQVTFNEAISDSDSLRSVTKMGRAGLWGLSGTLVSFLTLAHTGPFHHLGRTLIPRLDLPPKGPIPLVHLDSDRFRFSPRRFPAKHAKTEPYQVFKDNFLLRESMEEREQQVSWHHKKLVNVGGIRTKGLYSIIHCHGEKRVSQTDKATVL